MPRYTKSTDTHLRRFGERLRLARSEAGMSQGELAAAIGVRGQSSVSAWEAGDTEPERDHVFKMEELFDLEPGTLTSLLGYGPPTFVEGKRVRNFRAGTSSIRRAIMADPSLPKAAKEAMLATYRAFTSSGCTTADSSPVAA